MKKEKEDFQQQILFEEITTAQDENETNLPAEQVVIENDQWMHAEDFINEEQEIPDVKSSRFSWATKALITAFVAITGIELFEFFSTGFSESPIITSIYAIAFVCIGFLAGSAAWREFKGLRQFKHQHKTQEQMQGLLTDGKQVNLKQLTAKITANLPADLTEAQRTSWQQALDSGLSDQELANLYSRIVLARVDEKAITEISKFSTEAVALVAISPVAIVDMALLLWRNLRMINKITALYGLQLGYWSRIKLIRQVFVNMAYAGASELLADVGTEMLGADMLGKVSARLAQGFGAGMLTARLGLKVMALSRPIPFTERKPALKHVRKAMIGQIKSILSIGNESK